MGTWNTDLFSNDITCDVRDFYIRFLKQQLTNEDAYKKTYEEYKDLLDTDEEALFWYALADTQWNTGRLIPEVKERALYFSNNDSGIFIEEDPVINAKWENTLRQLEARLNSPMPAEKKFRKPIKFAQNPWNTGDVYAYQFHTDKAIENGLYKKYILLQKIGNVEYYEEACFSVVQFFNQIFDTVPNIEIIKNISILPLVYSPGENGCPDNISDYVPSFEWHTKATMIYDKKNDYPKNHLIFVGNVRLPEIQYAGNDFTDFYWSKNGMDDWLIDYYLSWLDTKQ